MSKSAPTSQVLARREPSRVPRKGQKDSAQAFLQDHRSLTNVVKVALPRNEANFGQLPPSQPELKAEIVRLRSTLSNNFPRFPPISRDLRVAVQRVDSP